LFVFGPDIHCTLFSPKNTYKISHGVEGSVLPEIAGVYLGMRDFKSPSSTGLVAIF
jgi:hypothetical protein